MSDPPGIIDFNLDKVWQPLHTPSVNLLISSNIIEIIESIATSTINMDNFNE